MAKESTVSFKLSVDGMRGKLATKQTNIRYTGQEEGQKVSALAPGKHNATNFEKYLVLTKRRGKQMFYVKSRTTVTNTKASLAVRAITALASPLVDFIYQLYQRGGALVFTQLEEAYVKWGGKMSIREYITSLVVKAMKAAGYGEEIVFTNADGQTQVLCANPYYEYNTPANRCEFSIGGESIIYTAYLPLRERFHQGMQNYFCKLMLSDTSSPRKIECRNTRGEKQYITLLATASATYGDVLDSTVQGSAYSARFIEVSEGQPMKCDNFIIYKNDGTIWAQGVPQLVDKATGLLRTDMLKNSNISDEQFILIEE